MSTKCRQKCNNVCVFKSTDKGLPATIRYFRFAINTDRQYSHDPPTIRYRSYLNTPHCTDFSPFKSFVLFSNRHIIIICSIIQIKSKSNLSLYSLYYAETCNKLAGLIFASLRLWAAQLLSKKCRSGGEPLVTLHPI